MAEWSNALDLRSTLLTEAQVRILLVLLVLNMTLKYSIPFASMAQLVERSTVNRKVTGSNPVGSDTPH